LGSIFSSVGRPLEAMRYSNALQLLLSFFLHRAASAKLQSNSIAGDATAAGTVDVLVAPRDRDVRTRAGTSTQITNPLLSRSTERHGQEPHIRILQGGDDDGKDDDGVKDDNARDDDEECKGSKFQIIIHFDAYPEDFAMRLRNDVTNKTIWTFDDPDHKYPASHFQHKTVGAGVCLPRDWCWVLTVFDKFGDGYVAMNPPAAPEISSFRVLSFSSASHFCVLCLLANDSMVGNELTSPSNGGGFRLMFNGLTVNYYTGKFNGCYKTMGFRFGEWCSDQEQFWYEPGEAGCGNFTAGRAPDDGWFEGDLYDVGGTVTNKTAPMPAPEPAVVRAPMTARPAPAAPVTVGPTDRTVPTAAPVRVGPTNPPVPATVAPVRLGPTSRPVSPTEAPVRVGPTVRPVAMEAPVREEPTEQPVPVSAPPTDEPTADPRVPPPTQEPTPTLLPARVPIAAVVAPSRKPAKPVLCHFRYCRHN
jgi:hypothetical protein